MLLDALIKSLFQPGCMLHLQIELSLLFSLFPPWSSRVKPHHSLTFPHHGLRLLWLQAGLQGSPQYVHHLLDGAGGVGDRLGVVDPSAQQSSVDVDVVILQHSHCRLHTHLHQNSQFRQRGQMISQFPLYFYKLFQNF